MNAGTISTARYRVDATMTAQSIRLPQSGRVQRMRRTGCKREGWWARGVCGRGVLSNVITPLPVADAGAVGVWRCGDGCKAGESGPRKCPWQTPLLWRWHKCGRRVRCARGVRGLASTPPARRCRRRGTIRGRRSHRAALSRLGSLQAPFPRCYPGRGRGRVGRRRGGRPRFEWKCQNILAFSPYSA